jgi:hypothetical protein
MKKTIPKKLLLFVAMLCFVGTSNVMGWPFPKLKFWKKTPTTTATVGPQVPREISNALKSQDEQHQEDLRDEREKFDTAAEQHQAEKEQLGTQNEKLETSKEKLKKKILRIKVAFGITSTLATTVVIIYYCRKKTQELERDIALINQLDISDEEKEELIEQRSTKQQFLYPAWLKHKLDMRTDWSTTES